jgi:hypothetical protein
VRSGYAGGLRCKGSVRSLLVRSGHAGGWALDDSLAAMSSARLLSSEEGATSSFDAAGGVVYPKP